MEGKGVDKMLDIKRQVKTAEDFPEKIVRNVVGGKKEEVCLYCGYEKCICQYKKGILGGR